MELRAGITLRKEKPSCQLQEQVAGVTVSVVDQSLAGATPASAASARAACTSLGGGSVQGPQRLTNLLSQSTETRL